MALVKAIKITDTNDEALKILNAVLPERRTGWTEISPTKIALQLGISEFRVRYNVNKFVALGYLQQNDANKHLYTPTKKVLYLNEG